MNSRFLAQLLLCLTVQALAAGQSPGSLPPEYVRQKADAEKLYSEKSFSLAYEAYKKAAVISLPGDEKRWVDFRLSDAQWRAQASTQTADPTRLDQARQQLEVLVRDITRAEERDRVWAEVHESLGDFHWTRRGHQDWGTAWPHYQQALDWWAGAADIETARERYLGVVWRLARPPGVERYYSYGAWGNILPIEIVESALKIARSENDKAHAHYLVAMTLRNQGGDWDQRARVPDEFEAAIKAGKKTDWHDDALYQYAEWMLQQGRALPMDDGNWRSEPDYVKAVALFRQLVTEYQKGETRYWEQAQNQIKSITSPQLSVSVANVFLPQSEIQYHLSWRNVKRIDLALYPVELNRDLTLKGQTHWHYCIDLSRSEAIVSWSRDTQDKGDYKPGNDSVRLEQKLKPGAYILEVKAGGNAARDLVLVTDATVVLKASGKQALVWFCNALNGEPLGGAKVKLSERWHENNQSNIRETEKTTDADGIARFDLSQPAQRNSLELFASAILKDRQAFSTGVSYRYSRNDGSWKVYAFTDRPAYRPKETFQWKLIARRYNGSVYSTPSEQTLEYQINDPQGGKVKEGTAKLNAFGSAWGSVELTEQMPLGEYHVQFWDAGRKSHIGSAALFRLEEYKVPEFKVSVQTPEERGRRKAFRLGEKVEVTIQADYYFGGPVANATVEVLVYQNPFYHYWHQPREFPWFYEDIDSGSTRWRRSYGGQGQVIKRETLKTDASGKASLDFDTPRGANQDFEYRIEARVTDASRREIIGSGNVRVTRQRYYVYADPGHYLYRPQDKVEIEFKAIDANEQPVQTDGLVKVTRDYWYEIWIDSEGKEVKGEELKRLRATQASFPPPPQPGAPGWRLKFRGYEHDEILVRTVKTDTNGVAELEFTPEREGYYRIAWSSLDPAARPPQPSTPITAETTVWIATGATTELGYRHSVVQVITDRDTFHVGRKAPVMLVVPTNDRYVLFTVEGEELYSYQVVRLEGTVKLLELPIEEKHVPNVFLGAALVSDRQVSMDTKQIVVPPTKNFLTVEVNPDRPESQPREEGTFAITTRDHDGRPVPAELAFSLVDESVFYIQQDYAGDPRQFYFGSKRPQLIQTQSTMSQKSYAKLVKGDKDALYDELEVSRRSEGSAGRESDEAFNGSLTTAKPAVLMSASYYGGGRGGAGAMPRSRSLALAATDSLTMPAAAPALAMEGKADAGARPGEQEPAVQVRADFRSTVLWQPDVVTDQNGSATVKAQYPDSLTGWKATVRAASKVNQFGIASATTRTRQPLIVRLQAPRFFVVGDTVTLSAVVNNNTDQPMKVNAVLEVAGKSLLLKDATGRPLSVPANGEARADWIAQVQAEGEVKLKITGRGDKHADAMEKTYLCFEHGIEKFIAKSGKARASDFSVKLELPRERKPGSTTLSVQVTPSLAVTMLDALPYLINYPYGCTEQTMSRFLPAAITAKTLKDLGLQPEDVMSRAFGGIEPAHAAATHRDGKQDLAELDKVINAGVDRLLDFQHADGGWGWWKEGESDRWMTAYVVWGLSLARSAGADLSGGKGKAAPGGAVDPNAGLPIRALDRGAAFLDKTLVEEEENPDMQTWMLHALAVYNQSAKIAQSSAFQAKAFENLWTTREKLNAYTRALLALAAHHLGRADQARTLVQNLENGVKRDDRPDTSVLINSPGTADPRPATLLGTAHWGEDGIYWRWSDGGVEATAFALRALLAIDPQSKLIEPVANWLVKNRRGAQWSNTRDTAIVVLTMNDYLRASGELKAEVDYELLVNGASVAKEKLSGADLFKAPSRFQIDSKLVKDTNEIRIRRKDSGPLYFAAEAKFFSLEEPVTPAGSEIFVRREYFKLVGRPTLLKGYTYEKQPLRDGETVKSGERVETLITIEAKNNYEYLVFEDLKPAGFEAVEWRSGKPLYARELKSGAVEGKFSETQPAEGQPKQESKVAGAARPSASAVSRRIARPNPPIASVPQPAPNETDFTGRTSWVYQELRNRKVALFLGKLAEGVWEIRYDLRAEVPGQFHALPVLGHAMYVPEIRCNGAELRVTVSE